MTLWKSEAKYAVAAHSGGTITADPQDAIGATDWLLAADRTLTSGPFQTLWGIRANIGWHSYGVGPIYEYITTFIPIAYVNNGFDRPDSPWTWEFVQDNSSNPVIFQASDGENGAAWATGGTLNIEKDTVSKTITFNTPGGSFTLTDGDNFWTGILNPLGQFFSTDALYGYEFAHSIIRGANVFGQTTLETARWHDFFTYQNGVAVFGAALTAADPGSFSNLDTVISGTFYDGTIADNQHATYLETGLTLNPASPAPGEVIHEHKWNFVLSQDYLDALVDPATGTLLYTTVRHTMNDQVRVGYSHSNGHSFVESIVDEVTDDVFFYPSITAHPNGLIYVFYLTSATDKLYYAVSRNKGRTWDAPLFLTILNPPLGRPKARFHPTTGVLFLTYFSPMDLNTYLQRIDAIGSTAIDATAILVRALARGPYDIYFDSNGRIMIATRDNTTGGRIVMFSRDGGNSFEDLSLGDFTDNASLAQVTTQSTDLGIGATIYQAADGTFYSYITDDNGQSRLLAESIILTGLGPQEFGHVHGPNHQFYFIFLVGSTPFQLVLCWISRDFVNFWAPA